MQTIGSNNEKAVASSQKRKHMQFLGNVQKANPLYEKPLPRYQLKKALKSYKYSGDMPCVLDGNEV